MKQLIRILLPLMLLLLIPSNGFCFDVTAQVSKNEISVDDSIILRITIEGGKADIDTSIIQDFQVKSKGSGTNVSIVNGNYSRTTSYTYLLFPLKKGLLTIPAIEVADGDKTARTERITITVSEQIINDSVTSDFFAKASISDSTLFTGQDAIYTFRFFFAANVYEARLEEHNVKGFSEKIIGKQKNYRKNINGIPYTINEINYLITPEGEDNFIIEPTSVIAKIDIKEASANRFDPFFSSRRTIKKFSSNSIEVKVNPIPKYDGNESYTGLIGDFTIKADINKKEMKVGESATLSIEVSGSGNIMDTSFENIDLPHDSFNIYDDQPEKKEALNSKGYLKKKLFKKALVPLKPGSFTLPEISLIYFDTKSGKYAKASTKPITLMVSASDKSNGSNLLISKNDTKTGVVKKKEVEFTGRDILPLKQGRDVLQSQKDLNFYTFILLITAPFILFCLIKLFTAFQKKGKANSVIMKQRAVDALKKAKDSKLSHEEFLIHIRSAVVSGILSKGDTTGESLTRDEAYEILQKSNLNQNEIEDILKTLNDIDSAKYGGGSLKEDTRETLFARAKQIIKLCSFVICMLSFSYLTPLDTQAAEIDESGTLFLKGIQAYQAGHFEKAADNFEKIALSGIKNGELYYNTANAFLKAGELGKAVLWYERAKKLIPFDADLEFNLDYAHEKLKDINDVKILNFSDILFFWKNFIPSSLVRYSAFILSFLFFLYSSIRVIKRKRIFTTSGSILFVLFLLVLSTAMFDYYQNNNSNSAIIIPDEISIRSGLSEDSTELFVLHAGTKVKIDKENSEFFRISFSKGKLGWIKKGDAVKI
jgi:tetratricopeptide (TPR) repeat protein